MILKHPRYEKINSSYAEMISKNIIIPEKYKTISEQHVKSFNDLRDFFRNNPIKINFRVGYSIARLDDHLVFKFY